MLTMRSAVSLASIIFCVRRLKPGIPVVIAAALLFLVIPASSAPRGQDAASLLRRADRLYLEKSYGAAADTYELALKTGGLSGQRQDEVEYRFDEALGRAKRWDRALEQGFAFVQQRRGTLWEARGLYWLGRLYLAVPNQGWSVGKRFFRGKNAPRGKFAAKPEFHIVFEQDLRNARDAFEAARILYPAYRSQGAAIRHEEIQLDFDLARVLRADRSLPAWAAQRQWPPPSDPGWRIDATVAYSPAWAPPRKLMFLYQSAAVIAGSDRHQAALALLGRALWLREYHPLMHQYAVLWKEDKPQPIPYPYQSVTAVSTLQELLRDPHADDDSVRDVASLSLASYLSQDNRLPEAEATLMRFLRDRPRSRWAIVAKRNLQIVRHPQLSVGPMETVHLPGTPARIRVAYRDVEHMRLRVFRLRLQDLYRRRLPADSNIGQLSQVESLPGPKGHAGESSPAIVNRELRPDFSGSLVAHQQTFTLPISAAGAYLVKVSAGGVTAANVVIVSDLALVQKIHRDGVLYFAADARTGAPVSGVKIIEVQEWSTDQGDRNARSRGITDASGLVTIPYARTASRQYTRMRALAYVGDRYAFTGDGWLSGADERPLNAYGLTDRAVYRPGQQAHYRLVVMRRMGGRLRPAAGARVQVVIRDPAGNVMLKRGAACSPYGTLHGDIDLRPEASLGQYSASVDTGQATDIDTFQFRVEEYKKPEFEVTVTPERASVLMGETATAKVAAHYYFGGPVPNARIKYRIFRENVWSYYHFPQPYDYLYSGSRRSGSSSRSHNGPPVEQGEARTNAQGTAIITFHTAAFDAKMGAANADYTVEAEVQDASRRVITGSGSVQAVHVGLSVYLNARRGYVHTGEAVEVDVAGVDPSSQPLPASGVITVVINPDGPKKWTQEVLRQPFQTNSDGKGRFTWRPAKAGLYGITFLTHDARGLEVRDSANVWVYGPDLAVDSLHWRSLDLVVEQPYYTEGQTARLLLVTPAPGCTVLLTREAGSVILEKRLVHVSGRAMELALPIHGGDAPDVTVCAALVRDRKMYNTEAQIRVPPVSQLATVAIHSDRARYEPGEKATLHLTARDFRGRPLRSELSLGITDASLDYIQDDSAQDIRSDLYTVRGSQSSPDASFDAQFEEGIDDRWSEPSSQGEPDWTLPKGMGLLSDWPGVRRENLDLSPQYGSMQNGLIQRAYEGYGGYAGMAGSGSMGAMMGAGRQMSRDFESGLAVMDRSARLGNDGFNGSWHQVPATGGMGGSSLNVNGDTGFVLHRPLDQSGYGVRRFIWYGQVDMNMDAVQVRRLFADTALWAPAVVTDAHGDATVRVTWPENLTRWRARAVAVGAGGEIGNADTVLQTKKDLLVRLSAPRFVVERDILTLSATIQNGLPHAASVRVRLKLGSAAAELMQKDPASQASASPAESVIDVPANGEKRVDWNVRALKAGRLPVAVTALSAEGSDAMEVSLPVSIHGAERVVTQAGVLREQNQVTLAIDAPGNPADPNAEVVVHLQPSLAVVALDALPYLIDDPYGCVEQTLSRFVPAVVVKKTLNDLGYDLQTLRRRAAGSRSVAQQPGVRRTSNSPYTASAARLDAAASSLTPPLPGEHAASPVFSAARLRAVVTGSLERLRAMQHADGGWGWWAHDDTDAAMTAYVVYGLLMARDAGTAIDPGMLRQGLGALKRIVSEEKDLNRLTFEVRVLAMEPKSRAGVRAITTGRLFAAREKLSIYSKALLALGLHDLGHDAEARIVLSNIEDAAHSDDSAGTVTWEETQAWWQWYNDAVETHAAVLQAYLAIQPGHRLVPRIVQWLAHEREGVRWSSTRETAMAVLALARYARANRELTPDYTLTVTCGSMKRQLRVTPANALLFDGRLRLSGATLSAGAPLTITKSGTGTLYYTVASRSFSQEERLKPVAGDLAVARRYFRLIPTASAPDSNIPPPAVAPDRPNPFLTGAYDLARDVEGTEPGSAARSDYRREPLAEDDAIASGDLIEVALQLESKQDFEYLIFEDIKPAGCEPVDLQSGEAWEPGVYSNRELRDQKVVFFIDQLAAGRRLLTYRLYAESPGRFHVLPTNAYAMYAPAVRALSAEDSLQVTDRAGGE
jgi:uncharacterized protein YfaS (alpha-2-macroglobulin family)